MGETVTARVWGFRALFVALVLLVIFVRFLPFQTGTAAWPGPDILVALIFAWTLRRPAYVPVLLVALAVLLSDLVFHRPPGLWSALVVLSCEALRARSDGLRDVPFPMEWLTVAVILGGATILYRVFHTIFVLDLEPLSTATIQYVMTLIVYPFVVLVSRYAFDIRKAAPGEVDERGHLI